jgi:hypothetical protein
MKRVGESVILILLMKLKVTYKQIKNINQPSTFI